MIIFLAFLLATLSPSSHAASSGGAKPIYELSYQIPVIVSPSVSYTQANLPIFSLLNMLLDVFHRGGARFAGGVDLRLLQLSAAIDSAWNLDIDVGRTPGTLGYMNDALLGLAYFKPLTWIRLGGGGGINYQVNYATAGTANAWGPIFEGSSGLVLGHEGHGFLVDFVYQYRGGITTLHYGLLRLGAVF